MRRPGYAIAFLLVLLAGCLGGFLLTRALLTLDVGRFVTRLLPAGTPVAPRGGETAAIVPTYPVTDTTLVPKVTSVPAPPQPSPASQATTVVVPTPVVPTDTPVPPTPTPTPTRATPTPTPSATPLPGGPAPEGGYSFVPVGPVRDEPAGCPGQYIMGNVYGRDGKPLAGVRLWRYDQWGNEAQSVSKSGQIDYGRYDFNLGDTPNVFYVTIIDAAGHPIAPVVEIQHHQGPRPEANCHFLDWRQVR